MLDWSQFVTILDFYIVYFSTQLVRCVVFSFVLLGLVMLLRKMLFSEQVFFRGMLWTSFLIIPFLGRLKLFYENAAIRGVTGWMTEGTMTCLWADRIYMAGILAAAFVILGKRLRLRRMVAGMEKAIFENIRILVTDMNVTPFTIGVLKPKIVLPKVMMENYSRDELKVIMQHEQTHIRLGHLWCGLAWDMLRCMLWINPFLSVCQKYFRADMEDICDKVCIQSSGRTAHEYGLILLKSLKILRFGQESIPPAAAYAGEKDFADVKRRIEKIAGFQPYRKRLCTGIAVVTFMAIGIVLLVIHAHSYPRYSESKDIMVYKYDGEAAIISNDTDSLSRMISYDDSYVYVDRDAFEDFLCQNNAEGEIYIIFGGCYKFPGLGSVAESCIYESGSKDDRVVRLPYRSIRNNWDFVLFRLL